MRIYSGGAAICALISGACGSAPATTGAPARPAHRVVSLLPVATELIDALGVGHRIVGRAGHDTVAARADLPPVGTVLAPQAEAILAVTPDLVIAWDHASVRGALAPVAARGVALLAADVQTLADLSTFAARLGSALGLGRKTDSLVGALNRDLQAVARSVAGRPRPTVLHVAWDTPPTTTGRGTFVHEAIELAGGRNIFDDAATPWPTVTPEAIVARDPDVIIWALAGASAELAEARLRTAPWHHLRAVRVGRVFVLDPALLDGPGPSTATAVRTLAILFHGPDLKLPEPEP